MAQPLRIDPWRPSSNQAATLESQITQTIQYVPGQTLRQQREASQPDLTGTINVVENDKPCFTWTGSKQAAIDLQRRYLAAGNMFVYGAESHARRCVGYLLVYGMPKIGDADHRPSSVFAPVWSENEVEVLKAAVLLLVMREHIPDTGNKVEDLVFEGEEVMAFFEGDAEASLEYTRRELAGVPQDDLRDGITMKIGIAKPSESRFVEMTSTDFWTLAEGPDQAKRPGEFVSLPWIPKTKEEAHRLLGIGLTIFVDARNRGPESVLPIIS